MSPGPGLRDSCPHNIGSLGPPKVLAPLNEKKNNVDFNGYR